MQTSNRFTEYRVRAVLSRVPRGVRSVLDYGCGQGSKIGVLQEMFPESEIFGIDISENAIKRASERFPRHRFESFEGKKAPFQGRGFDLVFSWHVLEHVWNLEETVQDMARLVNDGGHLCAILPCGNPGSVEEKVIRLVHGEEQSRSGETRWIYEDEGHMRRVESNDLVRAFERNGLALKEEFYAMQSLGGVFNIFGFGPGIINRMLPVRRAGTAGRMVRAAGLKGVFLFGALSFSLASRAHMDEVLYRLSVGEWDRHRRERDGSEQSLIFQKGGAGRKVK